MRFKNLRNVLFLLYVVFIMGETLIFREQTTHRIFKPELLWAIRGWINGESWGIRETAQYFENILFFMPFGFLFPHPRQYTSYRLIKTPHGKERREAIREDRKKWIRTATLAAFLLSAFIEITQYITMRGWCEVDDVITNTVGAWIGANLAVWIEKKINARRD